MCREWAQHGALGYATIQFMRQGFIQVDTYKPRVKSELRKQQLTVTLSDCNHLARCYSFLGKKEKIQKFICYCTVFALFYFVFKGIFQVKGPRGLYSYLKKGCFGNWTLGMHLCIWKNAMIYLNNHLTIASQCPIPKARSNLY